MRERSAGLRSTPASARVWTVSIQLLLVLLGALMVLGCGGGSGSGSSGLDPTITIDWPARSRDVSAPSSATSVGITVQNSSTGPNGITAFIDRGNNSSAFTNTYSLPMHVAPGTYNISIAFYPLEDGGSNDAGNPVGIASGQANVSSTSLSLGTFTTTGSVVSVGVLSGQSVPVGSTVMLNAAAYNSASATASADLVVTPGSVFWAVTATDGSMTVTPDGHVTATAAGSITVTATIDGIVSTPVAVTSYAAGAVTGCMGTPSAPIYTTYMPNYVQEMTTSSDPTYSGQLRHWTSFPITVAIISNSHLTSDFQTMAQQAMASWTSGTSGQATFQIVAAAANPDVTITFEPSHDIDNSSDGTVGTTTIIPSTTDNTVMSHADILVATDLSTDAQTLNTITHELGHSLGIGGHSNVNQDLMFPFLNDAFAPAADDTNTLFTAYCGSFPTTSPVHRAPRPPRSSKVITIVDRPAPK